MSGRADLYVQPSRLVVGTLPNGTAVGGVWAYGIPTAGVGNYGIPAVVGVADCSNLVAASPPTLLEQYDVSSYSIAWSAIVANSAALASAPVVTAELALLVNDAVRHTNRMSATGVDTGGASETFIAGDVFTADLVNPVTVGARERLTLRIGLLSSLSANAGAQVVVGVQLDPITPGPISYPSTVSYYVIDVPASRRL